MASAARAVMRTVKSARRIPVAPKAIISVVQFLFFFFPSFFFFLPLPSSSFRSFSFSLSHFTQHLLSHGAVLQPWRANNVQHGPTLFNKATTLFCSFL